MYYTERAVTTFGRFTFACVSGGRKNYRRLRYYSISISTSCLSPKKTARQNGAGVYNSESDVNVDSSIYFEIGVPVIGRTRLGVYNTSEGAVSDWMI